LNFTSIPSLVNTSQSTDHSELPVGVPEGKINCISTASPV